MRRIADEDYTIGRKVFYKQQNLKRWQDHPTTNGFDSKVLVHYGPTFCKCHPYYLMKVTTYLEGELANNTKPEHRKTKVATHTDAQTKTMSCNQDKRDEGNTDSQIVETVKMLKIVVQSIFCVKVIVIAST